MSARRLSMLHFLALVCLPAAAQGLVDPTRPPVAAMPQAGGGYAVETAPAGQPVPQLQSILIGSGGRAVAVIDGQTVPLGGKFNGAVLVNVGRNQVELRRGRKIEVLKLAPADAAVAGKTRAAAAGKPTDVQPKQ